MFDKIDLAIIYPDPSNPEVQLLKSFFCPFGLSVSILPYNQSSLDQVVNSQVKIVIVFNEENTQFAQQFIIESSIKKIFSQTTFYHLSMSKIGSEDQIRLMTLGYSGFLTFPFNATETQNTVDLNDCLMKVA